MNYELAKQLKGAGYPQEFKLGTWACIHGLESIMEKNCNCSGDDLFYAPTLSELIGECGNEFIRLEFKNVSKDWVSMGGIDLTHIDMKKQDYQYAKWGKTPEEVVAKLWLELNKI